MINAIMNGDFDEGSKPVFEKKSRWEQLKPYIQLCSLAIGIFFVIIGFLSYCYFLICLPLFGVSIPFFLFGSRLVVSHKRKFISALAIAAFVIGLVAYGRHIYSHMIIKPVFDYVYVVHDNSPLGGGVVSCYSDIATGASGCDYGWKDPMARGIYFLDPQTRRIKKRSVPNTVDPSMYDYAVSIFLHNSQANTDTRISYAQAEEFSLDQGTMSLDGYEVTFKEGLAPPENHKWKMYIGNRRAKLLVNGNVDYSSSGPYFLGWVRADENKKTEPSKSINMILNFKTYKNTQYGFELKYPASWTVEDRGAESGMGIWVNPPDFRVPEGGSVNPYFSFHVVHSDEPTNEKTIKKTFGARVGFVHTEQNGLDYVFFPREYGLGGGYIIDYQLGVPEVEQIVASFQFIPQTVQAVPAFLSAGKRTFGSNAELYTGSTTVEGEWYEYYPEARDGGKLFFVVDEKEVAKMPKKYGKPSVRFVFDNDAVAKEMLKVNDSVFSGTFTCKLFGKATIAIQGYTVELLEGEVWDHTTLVRVINLTPQTTEGCVERESGGNLPLISSIEPIEGAIGTIVKIIGSGFTPTNNKIKFGNLGSENNPVYNINSSDGKTLIFKVPSSNYLSCWSSHPACLAPATLAQPGTYLVSVINANGTGNQANFVVVGK